MCVGSSCVWLKTVHVDPTRATAITISSAMANPLHFADRTSVMCNLRIALVLCLGAMSASAEVKVGGAKMIPLDGGKYNVWTKRVGHGTPKLLTLHGGPGFPHDYLEVFEDFLPKKGIEFYYYDQLGAGNSDQPDDTSLWTIDRYREEVEQVRKGLGIDGI